MDPERDPDLDPNEHENQDLDPDQIKVGWDPQHWFKPPYKRPNAVPVFRPRVLYVRPVQKTDVPLVERDGRTCLSGL